MLNNIVLGNKHLKTIITQLHVLREIVSKTLVEVRSLKSDGKVTHMKQESSSFFTQFSYITFPIENETDFQTLEVVLSQEDHFRDGVSIIVLSNA